MKRAVLKNFFTIFNESEASEIADQRLSICASCPQLSSKPIAVCKKCGCILSLKVRLRGSICPEGAWKVIEPPP